MPRYRLLESVSLHPGSLAFDTVKGIAQKKHIDIIADVDGCIPGIITDIINDAIYSMQIGGNDKAIIAYVSDDDLIDNPRAFRLQDVYCNNCGQAFKTDFRRWDGRLCGESCSQQFHLKRAIYSVGTPTHPVQPPQD